MSSTLWLPPKQSSPARPLTPGASGQARYICMLREAFARVGVSRFCAPALRSVREGLCALCNERTWHFNTYGLHRITG